MKKVFVVQLGWRMRGVILGITLSMVINSMAFAAQPVIGAESYYRWLRDNIDAIGEQLPAMTQSAEAAAKAYVQDGYEIALYGDLGLLGEADCRAGGLMEMRVNEGAYPRWKGIVLLFPSYSKRERDIALAATFLKQSKMVIAFGPRSVLEAAGKTGVTFNAFIETCKTHQNGVFKTSEGTWIIPSSPVPDIVALWIWTGEFVAACTRLGKMPPIYQSWIVPGSAERTKKYRKIKFHAETPQRIEAGKVGRAYLKEIKSALELVHDREIDHIRQVAFKAAETIRAGHIAYVSPYGHSIINHLSLPCDPGYFKPINNGWTELQSGIQFHKGDFVFCVGYDSVQTNVMHLARQAGAEVAWSFTDYNKDPQTGIPAIAANEVFINQHWALGDAVVPVPGYDVKILPSSSVLAEASLWMVEAEMVRLLHPSPIKR